MCLLGKSTHGLSHTFKKEPLSTILTAMAVGSCDEFLGLGDGEGGE